jgi:hypothetical protein
MQPWHSVAGCRGSAADGSRRNFGMQLYDATMNSCDPGRCMALTADEFHVITVAIEAIPDRTAAAETNARAAVSPVQQSEGQSQR